MCAIALVLGLIAWKKSKWQRAVPWLFLVGGLGIAGVAGAVIDRIAEVLTRVVGATTGAIFGAAAPIVLVIALGVILFFGMHPKKGTPTKWTPWLALIFPAVLAAVPGLGGLVTVAVNFLTAAGGLVGEIVSELIAAFTSAVGG